MATVTKAKNVTDVKYIENVGTVNFTLAGYTGENVVSAGHVAEPTIPAGYTRILFGARVNGDASVVPVGINSFWVYHTKNETSLSLTAVAWAIAVKY